MIKRKDLEKDKLMAKARRDIRWEEQFSLSIDPEKAREIKAKRGNGDHGCTMCGRFCANDILKGVFEKDKKGSDKA